MKRVVIVGAGFAGLNTAKMLGNNPEFEVTILDRSNHHLFQPLIYQVAMAGLSPADVAVPTRSILSKYKNIFIYQTEVTDIDVNKKIVISDFREFEYDFLVLATGAKHSYFGNDQWEDFAPGLKNLSQATEIRRRVLTAFEEAEKTKDINEQRKLLTFVVVGGGPTGVELAGAIGEMSRNTLSKEFKNIDSKLSRVILIEAGPRILPSFSSKLTSKAVRNLEGLGVQVWTNSMVTNIDKDGVCVGDERLSSSTVLWAAGVEASELASCLGAETDRNGRTMVNEYLNIDGADNIFVAGDMAHTKGEDGNPLPGVAPVAMQQGKYIARELINLAKNGTRTPFKYFDKGQMATIGRSKAIVEFAGMKLSGFVAWVTWLFVHILYLTGFKNRVFVIFQWGWSYLTFHRGARLVINKDWKRKTIKKE